MLRVPAFSRLSQRPADPDGTFPPDSGTVTFPEDCYMEPLRLAARIIIENGGESFRVEETVSRMGISFGLREVECFAVPSGVFFSFLRADGQTETAVLRARSKGTDLDKVNRVNQISRDLAAGLIEKSDVLPKLMEISERKASFPFWLITLGVGFSSAGFAVLFGGSWIDAAGAFVITALVWLLNGLLQRVGITGNAPTLLDSFLITFALMLFNRLTGLCSIDAVIAGSLMPLVPGLAMTSAVQDTIRGDVLSGLSHGIQALLTAVLIAAGALLAAGALSFLTGGAAI